jgi:hypothetical protein
MKLAFGKNIIPELTEDELFQIQDTSEKWFEDLLLVNKHLSNNNSLDIAGKWENIKMRFDVTLRSSQDTSEQWQIRNVQLYWLHGMFKQLLLLSSTILLAWNCCEITNESELKRGSYFISFIKNGMLIPSTSAVITLFFLSNL